jgi:hypothetical protein
MRLVRHLRNALVTDADILRTAELMVGRATRREPALRFIALDDRCRASPRLLSLLGYPRMDERQTEGIAAWVDDCADVVEIDALIAVWQRRGSGELAEAELAWMRGIGHALRARDYAVRAWLLSHSRGLRWVAMDDLLPPREPFSCG